LKFAYTSTIIPREIKRTKFNKLPIPNNLKSTKIVAIEEIMNPRLELVRTNAKIKKRKAKNSMKNIKIKKLVGSVK